MQCKTLKPFKPRCLRFPNTKVPVCTRHLNNTFTLMWRKMESEEDGGWKKSPFFFFLNQSVVSAWGLCVLSPALFGSRWNDKFYTVCFLNWHSDPRWRAECNRIKAHCQWHETLRGNQCGKKKKKKKFDRQRNMKVSGTLLSRFSHCVRSLPRVTKKKIRRMNSDIVKNSDRSDDLLPCHVR